jgi:hypothetical protein
MNILNQGNTPSQIPVYSGNQSDPVLLEGGKTVTLIKDSDEPLEVIFIDSHGQEFKSVQEHSSRSYFLPFVPRLVMRHDTDKIINVKVVYVNTFALKQLVKNIYTNAPDKILGIITDGYPIPRMMYVKITNEGWPFEDENKNIREVIVLEDIASDSNSNYIHSETISLLPEGILQVWTLSDSFVPQGQPIYQRQ